MVRFKVIKGSHLLLGMAIVVLMLVIGALILITLSSQHSKPVSTRANLVQETEQNQIEAETDSVFASININSTALQLDPKESNELSIEIISSTSPTTNVGMPAILIYHTHTHEAYEQVMNDQYIAIEAWRTNDHDHSVVRVGKELAEQLENFGFDVVHDTTDHELNELGTAYTRSLKTLESYQRKFDLYIDLHRDAYIEGYTEEDLIVNDQPVARLMLLIGNGEGFDVKPHYQENLSFAKALTSRINQFCPELCNDVMVKDGRYNQNIGVFSVLVEVGHNMNTLEEALNAVPYLAKGIQSLMVDEPVDELIRTQRKFKSPST